MPMCEPGPLFRDRRHAGRALAARLERYRGSDALVLGLPRGGADEVVCLHAPASFKAVGIYYVRLEQASDDKVRRLLQGFTRGAILPYAR